MWSERWGESGMRSIEMKQNSGGQRDTEQWHSCEWQRLGDQSGEYSRGGVSAFDVGNADQTHHQQGLQKTTGWAGYSPPLPWQVQMMQGFWDVWMLSFWKYNDSEKKRDNLTAAGRFSKRHHSWIETVDNTRNCEKQATALSFMQIKPIWSAVLYITQLKEV